MIYLLAKIVIWLLLAAFFGFLIGWYLHKHLTPKTAPEIPIKQYKKDNLQRIRGIGVKLELKLNQLDIYSFEQIANWDKNDLEKISTHIGLFGDRIKRDNWISQAKGLIET